MRSRSELAKRRKAKGLSQEKLAELLGVHRSTIIRWEGGGGADSYARNQEALGRHLDVRHHELQLLFANRPIDGPDAGEINDGEGLLGLTLPIPEERNRHDAEMIDPQSILGLLEQLAAVDNNTGPATVLPMVVTQQERITRMLTNDSMRTEEALYVTSRFAEFRGWLHHDMGHLDLAMRWTNTALDLAVEAGDAQLAAYHYMRKSNIASDAHRQDLAIEWAQRSRLELERLSPRVRAVALRQEAQAHALLGDDYTCSIRLDEAHQSASSGAVEDDFAVYCSPNYIEMEAANAWLELGRTDQAIPVFEAAESGWSTDFRRDHGLCKSRLSLAYAGNDQPAEALAKAKEGAAIAKVSGSERSWHFLRRTAAQLDNIGARDEAEQLRHELPLAG